MTTLEALQGMPDGKFHLLGDALLRRRDSRYRHLRTHGANDRGESIKGQPDSYVGDTAATCTVAVCYTVQRANWWTKLVEDVRSAVAASPNVAEVVTVIPHNSDRDGPRGNTIDWVGDARNAAGTATVRFIDGRDLSQMLDADHQDLRHDHLGIPYSRVCGAGILAGCRSASTAALGAIRASGRYDPERYAPRSDDRELYRLWQSAFRTDTGDRVPVRLVALVNDSGVGKTSLVCEFTRSLGRVLPVLLVQARDLAFGTEDSLVAFVVQAIQGFLAPSVRFLEEAALARHLAGPMPLTVVLDGLDEARAPDAVRRAITFWLRSRLGQTGVLIATSRPEFWKACSDPSWVRWLPRSGGNNRAPVTVADRSDVEPRGPAEGIRLPGLFTHAELEAAWVRAGRLRQDLFTLPEEAREELRHPFTLRVFLDLYPKQAAIPRDITRQALLETWLNRRLDTSAAPGERIGRSQFQQALRVVASATADSNAGSVAVDELSRVPRFDPARPPGSVVQRLIECSILESLPGQPDRLRFAVEAVQDFYRAEADVEEIRQASDRVAERLSQLRFTDAYPRLVRVGQRLADEEIRHAFAERLAELDARMAAVVLRAAPDRYSAPLRANVVGELGRQIAARHRVRAALAITLLGELDCAESYEELAARRLRSEHHRYLKPVGARAFIRLGRPAAAEYVYRHQRFGLSTGNESRYDEELLALLRGTPPDFRAALAEQAAGYLDRPTDSTEHAKAVMVLAYLGEPRLVEHLAERFVRNGLLANDENHALIALGTETAAELFAESVRAVGRRLAPLPDDVANNKERYDLISLVHFLAHDIRYLLTAAFEPHLRRLIEEGDLDVSWIASDLAQRGHVATLHYPMAVAAAKRNAWLELDDRRQASVTPDAWMGWWAQSLDIGVRKKLLNMLPSYPSPEIEAVLLECLDEPELQGAAANRLGEYGSVRSAPRLRELLAEADDVRHTKVTVADALGKLRDESSIPLLVRLAEADPDSWTVRHALMAVGFMGTPEAERALLPLLSVGREKGFERVVLEALIACGSREAVTRVLARARMEEDGRAWLCDRVHYLLWTRGWSRGKYYTHIDTAEVTEYLESFGPPRSSEETRSLVELFEQLDSPELRRLLKKWASLRDTSEDAQSGEDDVWRLSACCHRELRDRGDEFAIDYTLDERTDPKDDIYVLTTASQLRTFPSAAVAAEIRGRLRKATTEQDLLRLLSLLGRFGGLTDAGDAAPFVDHPDDLVANAACEAMFRTGDPMLVPDGWWGL